MTEYYGDRRLAIALSGRTIAEVDITDGHIKLTTTDGLTLTISGEFGQSVECFLHDATDAWQPDS